jgi:hypothetical protein
LLTGRGELTGDGGAAGAAVDASRSTTSASSGVSGFAATADAVDDIGGPGGADDGFGRLQAEKAGSGRESGGNSDSGGLDDDTAAGSAGPVPVSEDEPPGPPSGANGRRAETRKPHVSQN